jgi:hypothetical protein
MPPETSDEDFRLQLEKEHAEAKERFEERKARSRDKAQARKSEKQELGEAKRQQAMREKFYKENGYKRYTNSRGKVLWLLPEEYAWRTRAKKDRAHRHAKYTSLANASDNRQRMVWIGLVMIAVVIGLALLR